jgi:hypothetical protein
MEITRLLSFGTTLWRSFKSLLAFCFARDSLIRNVVARLPSPDIKRRIWIKLARRM